MPLHNLTGDVKVIILLKGLATSGKLDLTIDDWKQRLPKKDLANRKYINTNN